MQISLASGIRDTDHERLLATFLRSEVWQLEGLILGFLLSGWENTTSRSYFYNIKKLMPLTPDKIEQCFRDSFNHYGASLIFGKRAAKIRNLQKLLLSGTIISLFIGMVALKIGPDEKIPKLLHSSGSVLLLIIGLASGIGLLTNRNGKLVYFTDSEADNHKLADEFKRLAESVESRSKLDLDFTRLTSMSSARSRTDLGYPFSENEKRWASRTTLYTYQWKCVICHKVPPDLIPGTCSACGNYKTKANL